MPLKYAIPRSQQQEENATTQQVTHVLEAYLEPLLIVLDAYLDKRLVTTFLQLIRTIIEARMPSPGLVLTELGAVLLSGRHAIAGEKRIHRLLTSPKWSEELIKQFQWRTAHQRYEELKREQEVILVVWDGSEVEKPESQHAEDLCAVKSSKAARRKKARKGAFNWPGGKPIVVLGFEWIACVVVGKKGKPTLVMMDFWSRKGPHASDGKREEEHMLMKVAARWGRDVLHVFDRGYVGAPWLEMMRRCQVDFLIRWKKGLHFRDENWQEKPLSQIGQRKRSWGFRMLWDEQRKQWRRTGIVAVRVHHRSYPQGLWAVIVRRGGEPWYLVTNRCIETEEQAWECYKAYCRRWQVETVFRFEKCELALETVRLWTPAKRQKLLHLISLIHSILLQLLEEEHKELVSRVLDEYCHRKGTKLRGVKLPIYRLRWALSRLWQEVRPTFAFSLAVRSSPSSRGSNSCSHNSG